MTESAAEELGPEAAEEAVHVVETGLHAAAGVYNAATGNWDGAADSALSMTEDAVGVVTGGATTAFEEGWDAVAEDVGLPTAHEAINIGAQSAGDVLGAGLESLVGDGQAHQSAVAFDDGDVLGGLGHMAAGAASTVGDAVEQGVAGAGQALSAAAGSVEQGTEDLWNEVTE